MHTETDFPSAASVHHAVPVVSATQQVLAQLTPIPNDERIEALDVVRGFALLGIFMMNIEFFNRALQAVNEGIPQGLTGLDWLACWFVNYFVQGKFWTIFSLLFGMGFAVMMTRAERAGRPFLKPYLRRILALAVFGAVHFIFLWPGDILFSYAVAAGALLILLYGNWRYIVGAMAIAAGLGFIFDGFFAVVAGLATVGLMALYMRNERLVSIRGFKLPIISLVLLIVGLAMSIAAIVLWVLPDGPKDPRIPLTAFSPLVLLLGVLSAKYHDPVSKRGVRMGVTLYLFMGAAMTIAGVAQYFAQAEPKVPDTTIVAAATAATASNSTAPTAPANAALDAGTAKSADADIAAIKDTNKSSAKVDDKTAEKTADKKPEKTAAQKAAERKADRAKRLATLAEEKRNEERVFSRGTYLEGVDLRARQFADKAAGDAGSAFVLIGMFLLGIWFVRSGVMENSSAHLPFFRNLALFGLPIGIGIGLIGSLLAVSHVPGDMKDGFNIGRGLSTLGSLPACLGYVGMVVLMLHSKTVFSRISILAPLGRMALTNYLMQSLICAVYFYGFGLGQWGMLRSQQLLFVVVVYALQIVFSHWWLARFRYGPMEWLWRGFTYRQVPKLSLNAKVIMGSQAVA